MRTHPKELTVAMDEIVQFTGHSAKGTARKLDINPSYVSKWLRNLRSCDSYVPLGDDDDCLRTVTLQHETDTEWTFRLYDDSSVKIEKPVNTNYMFLPS